MSARTEVARAHQSLEACLARLSARPPRLAEISGAEMPEPYRELLVHDGDMTPTLERFHHASIHLRVLCCCRVGERYQRQVVLELDGSGLPVEYGAIEIYLDRFPAEGRELILAARRPLGAILRDLALPHASRPSAFLRVHANHAIRAAFGMKRPETLYGRRNTLLDAGGEPLARIVEILPPSRDEGKSR